MTLPAKSVGGTRVGVLKKPNVLKGLNKRIDRKLPAIERSAFDILTPPCSINAAERLSGQRLSETLSQSAASIPQVEERAAVDEGAFPELNVLGLSWGNFGHPSLSLTPPVGQRCQSLSL